MKNFAVLLFLIFPTSVYSQVPSNTLWLSDMDLTQVDQDMGAAGKNQTAMGGAIVVSGETFANGVGISAPSKFLIQLNGNGQKFTAQIGVCEMRRPDGQNAGPFGPPPGAPAGTPGNNVPRDSSRAEGGPAGGNAPRMQMIMEFHVLGDKKVLWSSGPISGIDKAKNIEVDIRGVQKLALVATGTGRFGGLGTWANAQISYTGNTRPKAIANKLEIAGIPTILTPAVKSAPQINFPKVVGATPGKFFLFSIPVTGEKPLSVSIENLPEGLSLDSSMGIISGISPSKKGIYDLKVIVKNSHGETSDIIKLKVGDLIALTPPMGWNSWNAGGMSVDQVKVKAAADVISEKLRGHGWAFVNIDDGWQAEKRNEDGFLLTNEKFSDIKVMSDYIHSKGLKFGIYSSPGPQTCGRALGSYQHEYQDAETWSKWGVDYLKYDWCSYGSIALDNSLEELQKPYLLMRDAIDKTNRDVVYSLCQYGMGDVYKWGAEVGGNLWRTTMDINDSWRSVLQTGFSQTNNYEPIGPGHWNDPDMLVIGQLGWSANTNPTKLTPDEQYSHISLWSLLASPMLIGCEMDKLDDFTLGLITNDEVIGVNQDILGRQAQIVKKGDDYQVWVKDLSDGTKAVGLFFTGIGNTENTDPVKMIHWGDTIPVTKKTISVDLKELGLTGKQKVRNLWSQQEIGVYQDSFAAEVNHHGVVLVKLTELK